MQSQDNGRGCADQQCVEAVRHDDGVTVTSNISGNDGQVVFTHDEWDSFLEQVKAGRWDHTATRNFVPI